MKRTREELEDPIFHTAIGIASLPGWIKPAILAYRMTKSCDQCAQHTSLGCSIDGERKNRCSDFSRSWKALPALLREIAGEIDRVAEGLSFVRSLDPKHLPALSLCRDDGECHIHATSKQDLPF